MPNQLQAMIRLVEQNMHPLQEALGPAGDTFALRYYEFTDRIGESPEEDERILTGMAALVAEYPAAQALLSAADPGVFPPPEPVDSISRAVSTGEPPGGPVIPTQGESPAPEPAPTQLPETPMSNDTRTATKSARKPWTVEQWIMIIKESITGILALLVVIFTLVIAMQAFSFAGTETKMSDAKDILLLMLGVAGVVIGYYFGRVPADARATQAQDQARDATAQAQEIKSEAESIASEMESMLSSAPSYSVEGNAQRGAGGVNYSTTGGEQATLNQDEWRKMRERVRRLQNMSREKM